MKLKDSFSIASSSSRPVWIRSVSTSVKCFLPWSDTPDNRRFTCEPSIFFLVIKVSLIRTYFRSFHRSYQIGRHNRRPDVAALPRSFHASSTLLPPYPSDLPALLCHYLRTGATGAAGAGAGTRMAAAGAGAGAGAAPLPSSPPTSSLL